MSCLLYIHDVHSDRELGLDLTVLGMFICNDIEECFTIKVVYH